MSDTTNTQIKSKPELQITKNINGLVMSVVLPIGDNKSIIRIDRLSNYPFVVKITYNGKVQLAVLSPKHLALSLQEDTINKSLYEILDAQYLMQSVNESEFNKNPVDYVVHMIESWTKKHPNEMKSIKESLEENCGLKLNEISLGYSDEYCVDLLEGYTSIKYYNDEIMRVSGDSIIFNKRELRKFIEAIKAKKSPGEFMHIFESRLLLDKNTFNEVGNGKVVFHTMCHTPIDSYWVCNLLDSNFGTNFSKEYNKQQFKDESDYFYQYPDISVNAVCSVDPKKTLRESLFVREPVCEGITAIKNILEGMGVSKKILNNRIALKKISKYISYHVRYLEGITLDKYCPEYPQDVIDEILPKFKNMCNSEDELNYLNNNLTMSYKTDENGNFTLKMMNKDTGHLVEVNFEYVKELDSVDITTRKAEGSKLNNFRTFKKLISNDTKLVMSAEESLTENGDIKVNYTVKRLSNPYFVQVSSSNSNSPETHRIILLDEESYNLSTLNSGINYDTLELGTEITTIEGEMISDKELETILAQYKNTPEYKKLDKYVKNKYGTATRSQ